MRNLISALLTLLIGQSVWASDVVECSPRMTEQECIAKELFERYEAVEKAEQALNSARFENNYHIVGGSVELLAAVGLTIYSNRVDTNFSNKTIVQSRIGQAIFGMGARVVTMVVFADGFMRVWTSANQFALNDSDYNQLKRVLKQKKAMLAAMVEEQGKP